MNQTDDRAFIRRFSGIIVGLVILTVVIIALALSMRSPPDSDANPSRRTLAEERIAPVAGVRTGEEDLAATAAPAEAVAEPAQEMAAAEPAGDESGGDEPAASGIDGQQVYNSVCMACHAAGVAGAPVPGSDVMAERAAKGVDELVSSVMNGLNVMPPKGGRGDLTEDQARAAVEFMLQ
jgi:cytochrome c5